MILYSSPEIFKQTLTCKNKCNVPLITVLIIGRISRKTSLHIGHHLCSCKASTLLMRWIMGLYQSCIISTITCAHVTHIVWWEVSMHGCLWMVICIFEYNAEYFLCVFLSFVYFVLFLKKSENLKIIKQLLLGCMVLIERNCREFWPKLRHSQ